MAIPAGTRLGTYEVTSHIGSGGMGEVYQAHDSKLGRDVALKVLPDRFARDPERLARFQREAKLLASLNHPNIATIHGLEQSDNTHYLVMELVPGETLAQRIKKGSALPVEEVLKIVRQIAEALEAAHGSGKGIIHRDLKPANLKITPDGRVKVLDFGLAKAFIAEPSSEDVADSPTLSALPTQHGMIMGTAAYMSPEQARGHHVDKRTDVWAFGCVLYELLSGQRAFPGDDTTDIIAKVLQSEPDWTLLPASTPAKVRDLVQRCLRKDLQRRLRDIGDARIELEDALENAGPDNPATLRADRRRVLVFALTGIFVTFLVGAAVLIRSRSAGHPEADSSSLSVRFSRVTWDSNFSTEPALSPDGTLVVYASDRGGVGQLDLWLQRVAGGQPIRLTDNPADDREPHFSPDGGLLAFRSNRDNGGVYVMPTLGGDARLVAERGRAPRFSPDGGRIVYWTGPWLGGPRSVGSGLFLVPATGGQPMSLTDDFDVARDPVWSPDGRSLIFFGRKKGDGSQSGGFDWWWLSLERHEFAPTGAYPLLLASKLFGSSVNNTVAPAPDTLPSAWTPDGVLFSARLDNSINLWRIQISQNTGKVIEDSLQRLTSGAGSDMQASVDKSGRVAFQVETAAFTSWTLPIDPNGGKALGAAERQAIAYGLVDSRNSLDDSGRFLAYAKTQANQSEIWVKDLTNGQERHVATTPLSQLNPVIAHDASKIAYTIPEGANLAGYVIPATGGTAKKVCDACNLQGWLADNRRILALTPNFLERVPVIDVTNGQSQVAISETGVGRVDPSPDDRWLAFNALRRIWIAPLRPGTPPAQKEWVPIHDIAPGSAERVCGWSPDGRLLYLLLENDGFRDLYAQRIDPSPGTPVGEPFVVQHLHDPRRRWGSTPYGTGIVRNAFVFNQTQSEGSIWLLDPGTQLQ
jgi:serine/threonine protein kinase